MKPWLLTPWRGVALALLALLPAASKADTWARPTDTTYYSENGRFQFLVTVGDVLTQTKPTGTLRRRSDEQWEGVWTNQLVNHVSPVQVMVHDSGRYVVTCDEYHSVGENPVVIHGEQGRLIAKPGLADLRLEPHPNISRSVSGYWWNESAIMIFGPASATGDAAPDRMLEDSLFIRLYWGEVIAIDLAGGKIRDAVWWGRLTPEQATALRTATAAYLDATWRHLARKYLRKENFDPDPSGDGILGILLAGQLRLREALPLLREVAATDRFQHWAAPRWMTGRESNVRALARAAIAEME